MSSGKIRLADCRGVFVDGEGGHRGACRWMELKEGIMIVCAGCRIVRRRMAMEIGDGAKVRKELVETYHGLESEMYKPCADQVCWSRRYSIRVHAKETHEPAW